MFVNRCYGNCNTHNETRDCSKLSFKTDIWCKIHCSKLRLYNHGKSEFKNGSVHVGQEQLLGTL